MYIRMTEEKVDDLLEEQDLSGNHQQGHDDVITIVLTADNHLGSTTFGQQLSPALPAWKREEHQQRLRHAFQQATDFAIGQGVDLFVQAGDLFDTSIPSERDRSFVAARLAQLRQAGIRTFTVGGTHDTPAQTYSLPAMAASKALEDGSTPAPQISYARLGALYHFAPQPGLELEPVMVKIRNVLVGICGLGAMSGQEGDPLTHFSVQSDIERAAIPLLILHAPIEGLSQAGGRSQVSRSSIENQSAFRYILAGYHHNYHHLRVGQSDVIVAGPTQYMDFHHLEQVEGQEEPKEPGFVFLGLASNGIRWCKRISVDALKLQRLVIRTSELWPNDADTVDTAATIPEDTIHPVPTDVVHLAPMRTILERLDLLCSQDALVQLLLEGQLTRNQYHQLDLHQLRRYGEEHCFALIIDDSGLDILSTALPGTSLDDEAYRTSGPSVGAEAGTMLNVRTGEGSLPEGQVTPERFSPREELVALADEWIASSNDEQEKKALRATKEELLAALDKTDAQLSSPSQREMAPGESRDLGTGEQVAMLNGVNL